MKKLPQGEQGGGTILPKNASWSMNSRKNGKRLAEKRRKENEGDTNEPSRSRAKTHRQKVGMGRESENGEKRQSPSGKIKPRREKKVRQICQKAKREGQQKEPSPLQKKNVGLDQEKALKEPGRGGEENDCLPEIRRKHNWKKLTHNLSRGTPTQQNLEE